jgi:hypothetical protein
MAAFFSRPVLSNSLSTRAMSDHIVSSNLIPATSNGALIKTSAEVYFSSYH